jgi:hypothetical protein
MKLYFNNTLIQKHFFSRLVGPNHSRLFCAANFIPNSSIMVKVLALSVFHKTPAATTELASVFELSQFGFFQRGTVQVKWFSRKCSCGVQSFCSSRSRCPTTHIFASGIHEVFLKNLRPKEHKPYGSGASPISNSTMCSWHFVSSHITWHFVSSHITLVGAHTRCAESYVLCRCFAVRSRNPARSAFCFCIS